MSRKFQFKTFDAIKADTAENRLKETFFLVEATDFEVFCLWSDYSSESDSTKCDKLKWEQVNPGWAVTIGKIGKLPIVLSVSWARIEDKLICFWYQCSRVTDSVKAETWLKKHFTKEIDGRWAATDASNFMQLEQILPKRYENH